LKDYFACDAGCLDPPVKLSTDPKTFPVKLTDPVTAVLYITSDQLHMQELKHAIHVKELSLGKMAARKKSFLNFAKNCFFN
jgi:hypothetical protein